MYHINTGCEGCVKEHKPKSKRCKTCCNHFLCRWKPVVPKEEVDTGNKIYKRK